MDIISVIEFNHPSTFSNVFLLVISYNNITPSDPVKYVFVIERYRSCPAVSNNTILKSNFFGTPLIFTSISLKFRVRLSIPIVDIFFSLNCSVVIFLKIEVFPTEESPIKINL